MDARGITRFDNPPPIHLSYFFMLYLPSPRSPVVCTRGPRSPVLKEIYRTNSNNEFGCVLFDWFEGPDNLEVPF